MQDARAVHPPAEPTIGSGARPPGDGAVTRLLGRAKQWLFTGNLVAKLGLVILFVGVGFLLKYAAERIHIPIEARIAGVAAADLGLLVWAWRIRVTRRDVALPAQGAAIAILMLVVFASHHSFNLIPAFFTFGLLVALTAFTCLLAVLQEAVWLAAFGIVGGFAVPILITTGKGSHIALFSYYALLNFGVFFISYARAWRLLNLLGFGFTFIVGAAWGWSRYVPDHYFSTQLFLILFFLLYVAIAIVFAHRRAPQLKKYFDATLLLGTPMIAFGLQYGLVRDKEYGMALSALALSAFYLGLANVLWRRAQIWRPLVEAFLALGVVFGTLTLPLALDNRWTSAAWALEGAGFVWVGLRRKQPSVWIFGLLVQFGAWMEFMTTMASPHGHITAESHIWLGFLFLAGSTFGMASSFRRQAGDNASSGFADASNIFLAIAGFWLLSGLWYEAYLRTQHGAFHNMLVALAFLTAIILNLIASRMQWEYARTLALIAQLAGAIGWIVVAGWEWGSLEMLRHRPADEPFLGPLMIAAGALLTSWSMQKRLREDEDKKISNAILLWGGFWWFGPLLYSVSGNALRLLPSQGDVYWVLFYDLLAIGSAIAFIWLSRRLAWRALRWFGLMIWLLLTLRTVEILGTLYRDDYMPAVPRWISYAAVWLGGELLLVKWQAAGWPIKPVFMKILHLIKAGGPWLAIWPAGGILVSNWLVIASSGTGLSTSGSWSTYLPAWVMMLAIAAVMVRTRAEAWPTKPVSDWYRSVLIPCAVAWSLLLVAVWNRQQDGSMDPLPYLPLLNPLDLTTGFAAVLAIATLRMLHAEFAASAAARELVGKLPQIGGIAAYAWFNLMLLRSASHFLHIQYEFEGLASSLFVQAMLSLVWTGTALILMRHAWRRKLRSQWGAGAVLLAIVVVKLALVDLSQSGSLERIVSFVGVGLLMLIIGYIAPFPKAEADEQNTLAA
ncbi:DUF2339 domain-containing protein [Massilia horti]|uniref:DUF2339 domain-containing protein n=2 Tax=Massilia horti TaxID=2562153 RepID=A0A4Y9T4H7_9BURK|nr:DUF2339 domain-containing protein [Massilia horti]